LIASSILAKQVEKNLRSDAEDTNLLEELLCMWIAPILN
jgi:hypothetical protein